MCLVGYTTAASKRLGMYSNVFSRVYNGRFQTFGYV